MRTFRATFNAMVESQLTTITFEYYVYGDQNPDIVAAEEVKKRLAGDFLFKAHMIKNVRV